MSHAAAMTDNDRYELACNQAIAMCDGNLRSCGLAAGSKGAGPTAPSECYGSRRALPK